MSPSTKTDSSNKTKAPAPKTPNLDPNPMAPNTAVTARDRSANTAPTATKTNDDETVFFETVTMSKFEKFQTTIFPIVTKITAETKFKDHPFTNLWNQAIAKSGQTFNSESTLRSIQKILPVENLQDYRRFLMECPSIEDYVTFQDSTMTQAGFDVYFKEHNIKLLQDKNNDNKQKGDTTEISSFDLLTDSVNDHSKTDTDTLMDQHPFQECFGNKRDFKILWTQVSFILNTFALEQQDHPIATKWKAWKQKGLNIRSDFQEVKNLTGLTSLVEFYFFLHDCPSINEFMEIKWDDKILFRQRPEPITVQQIETLNAQPTTSADMTVVLEANSHEILSSVKEKSTGTEPTRKSVNDPPHSPFVDMFHNAEDNDPYDMLDYYTVDESKILTTDDSDDDSSVHEILSCKVDKFGEEDDVDEDKLARQMVKMMTKHAGAVSKFLIERSSLIDSICWLARHIPLCVLDDLREDVLSSTSELPTSEQRSVDKGLPVSIIECKPTNEIQRGTGSCSEIYQESHDEEEAMKHESFCFTPNHKGTLPYASYHKSAILFVDISGFTKLSQILNVEHLSKTINTYFEMIVERVTSYGGDVLKFAGDSIFVEWAVGKSISESSGRHMYTLEQCAMVAALCAASIAETCRDFPIYNAPEVGLSAVDHAIGTRVGSLNLHCVLGVGDVAAVHVGDDRLRREFLVVGDPIDQIAKLEKFVSVREVAVSPEAMAVLANVFHFDADVYCSDEKPAIILDKSRCHFQVKSDVPSLFKGATTDMEQRESIALMFESFDATQLKRLHQLISLYAHHVVARGEFTVPAALQIDSSPQERLRAEAELRDIYTIFIMPLISSGLKKKNKSNAALFHRLNDIFIVVNRELARYGGHLRQYIIDDKGIVLIATFGLRGATFPNMISCHGLPCTVAIHNALQVELDVESQIGGTFGTAYCGVVGGVCRHEYSVLGPCVNLSARLMSSAYNPGIIVDNNVRLKASTEFSFNALEPVKAKGYVVPVPIFEPLSAPEKRWGKATRDFVGRVDELDTILRWAKDIAYSDGESKMLFIQAKSGFGKSALVVQALSDIRKMGLKNRKRVIITRNISNEGDRMIPFSMFRSIFKDILNEMHKNLNSSDSISTVSSLLSSAEENKEGESLSVTTVETSGANSVNSLSSTTERLLFLAKEVEAPPEFLEIARHILGIRDQNNENVKKTQSTNLEAIVHVMARAFLRCTNHAHLVVLVLDDIHLLDELSWKFLKVLFKLKHNLLILCASRPLKSHKIEVDSAFWNQLHEEYTRQLRFSEMHLTGLTENDIQNLISKKLGVRVGEIDRGFCIDLHAKSGGMPHFACQMLETIKKNDIFSILENGKIGWRKDLRQEEKPDFNFATVGELMVNKIDSLDAPVRTTLHLCSVLGSEFELFEIITVYQSWLQFDDSQKSYRAKLIMESLNAAVNEGIIEEIYEGGQLDDSEKSEGDIALAEDAFDEIMFASKQKKLDRLANISYRFHHDMWRENILRMMLDSRKRDLHRVIAESLDSDFSVGGVKEHNYYSMIKLLRHWKLSGNASKTILLALEVGRSLINVCMSAQALKIFDEAIDMLRKNGKADSDDMDKFIGGFPLLLTSLDVDDLKATVQIHIEKGKCLSNLHLPDQSVQAYNDALSIVERAPASAELKDRSITFPVFSGLFVLLKASAIVQDRECTYEQEIVRRFVAETKLHGDPVHYGRALSMQAEVLARLGKVFEALESLDLLSKIYNVDEHSAAVCKTYGSDRCAQVFSLSAMWCLQLGNEARSVALCEFVIDTLLPKMDLKNVHNSLVLLWPLYSVLKERGQAKKMRALLEKYVFQPFAEYYGEGHTTTFLSLYKPAGMLLEVCEDVGIDKLDEKVEWVLSEGAGVFTEFLDSAMGNYGRTCSQVTAEICLCLTRRVSDPDIKLKLVTKGVSLARMTSKLCRGVDDTPKLPFAFERNKPIHEALEDMAIEYGVSDKRISSIH